MLACIKQGAMSSTFLRILLYAAITDKLYIRGLILSAGEAWGIMLDTWEKALLPSHSRPRSNPSCLRGVSPVPGCSTAHLFLHHTFQLSPEENFPRDLRTETQVLLVRVSSSSTVHCGSKQVQFKNSCSLHVAAA